MPDRDVAGDLFVRGQEPGGLRGVLHRGLDARRRNVVHRDADRGVLPGQRFCQRQQCALGGGVVRGERGAALGAGRRDHLDPSPARVDHVRQRDLAAVEGAGQVDLDEALPVRHGDVGERRVAEQAGAGDQNAHRAQSFAHLGERLLDAGAVADVDGHRDGLDAVGAQRPGDPLGGLGVDVGHRDAVAPAAQFVAGRLAHPGGSAGDDGDPASHSAPSPSGWWGWPGR